MDAEEAARAGEGEGEGLEERKGEDEGSAENEEVDDFDGG